VNQLIKNSKLVKTAIAAAALGLVAVGAHAATISNTSTPFATQVFAGTTPGAQVTLRDINVNAVTALPTGSTVTVMVQLTGARFAAPISGTAPTMTSAAVTAQSTAGILAVVGAAIGYGSTATGATAATGDVITPTASTSNADFIAVTIVTNQAIGVGGRLLTLTTPLVSAPGMATSGATITANASVYVGAVVPTFGVATLPVNGKLEADAPATTVATNTNGVTITTAASATTQRIDLNTTVASSAFTAPATSSTSSGLASRIQIGTLSVVDTTTGMAAAGVGTPYAVGTKTSRITLTAPAGYFAGWGTAGQLEVRANDAISCNGAIMAAGANAISPAFGTVALAAAATSVQTAASQLGNATATAPLHICIGSIPGTIALVTGAGTLTGTLGVNATQDTAVAFTSTPMASLATNGSQVDVNAYWPASLAAFGYGGFVRVINNGTMAAPISMAYINSTTGAVGTAAVVIASLPAGASQMLSAATIEAAVGAQPFGTAAGRVRVTAPTTSLRTQSFVQVGNTLNKQNGKIQNKAQK